MVWLGVACISGFLVSGLALFGLLRYRHRFPLDHPNERSLHSVPTPRIGGLGIVVGVAAALMLRWPSGALVLALPAALLAVVSLFDDYLDLSARSRLLAHFLAAGASLWLMPTMPWAILIAALFALVWMTNLYNFMDGADGLAGGMALFGFTGYAVLAWLGADLALAELSGVLAAAALGFLLFNFPPARLFMGDAGSIPLGFLAAAIGLKGMQSGLWPWAVPPLLFSPFIVDASVTLARRAGRRERIWQAHRSHYYQRLVRMGWSHRRLALAEYALMACVAVSAVWLVLRPMWTWGILAAWSLFYVWVMTKIDKQWVLHQHAVHKHAV